jgi:hypothetical protein
MQMERLSRHQATEVGNMTSANNITRTRQQQQQQQQQQQNVAVDLIIQHQLQLLTRSTCHTSSHL